MAVDAGAADIGGQDIGEITLHGVALAVGTEQRCGINRKDARRLVAPHGPVIRLTGFRVHAIGAVKRKGAADAVALRLKLDDVVIARTAGDDHGQEGQRQRQAGAKMARVAPERLGRFHKIDRVRGIMLRAFIRIKRDWRGKGIIDLGI